MEKVTYRFHFEGKWQEVTGTSDQVLVEMTMAQDIRTPHACREGGCGTCKARLLEGRVAMAPNDILGEEDMAQGFILACQSKPLTHTVVLDYDIE
jgi:3-ketosteroid 9alpha-monooxygenase subunit B